MKKLIFSLSIIGAMSFVSCGPSAEEQKALDDELLNGKNTMDSLWKKAEETSKDSGAVTNDSTKKQ